MPSTSRRIIELLDHPEDLEALYRADPEAFRTALEESSREVPDSPTLRVWRARLDYKEVSGGLDKVRLGYAVAIGLFVGALIRVPLLWIDEDWYLPRFGPSLVLFAPAVYFWLRDQNRRGLMAGLVLALVAAVFAGLMPGFTDSVTMALIHLPILFWALLGFAFAGAAWRDPEARVRFVRYNGELLILASLVALGGFVFSGLTVALFQLAFDNWGEWYAENIGIVGAAAVPLAGTYLYDTVFKRRTGIASVLARVFAPLFLVMTATYLGVALLGGQNPFVDRDALIIFNGLLLVVLGMTVFSIVERGEQTEVEWLDYINAALLVVTLLIDLVALAAILFRLGSYGLTPNRVVVLGVNLVVMIHLAWTCRAYLGLIRAKSGVPEMRRAVVGYLPVYAGWAAFVAFVLPVLFRFS